MFLKIKVEDTAFYSTKNWTVVILIEVILIEVIHLTMKKALICLSIVAIVLFCTLNVATASTSNYSATFHNNARHTGDHMLMAKDNASKGISNWNYVTEGILTSSITPNGIVYVGSDDHNVYALNADTGMKIWNYTTGSAVYSSPIVANRIVYMGSRDNNVYALNATTGMKVWSYTTRDAVQSSPTVTNGIVYVGSYDHNVYALNATTGMKVWSYTTGRVVYSSPIVTNGIVYVGSDDHYVYALNAGYRGDGVELHDQRRCTVVPHRHQWNRLRWELGS